jgi:RES domain-containing protein
VRLWRIVREPFQALDGEGARLNGGRWNSEGVPVVYLSSSLSLSALEYLVHLDIDDAPVDLVAVELDAPDDIAEEYVAVEDLPADWNRVPDHPECVRRGDEWALASRACLLRVPSAVVSVETNVLLNPRHADSRYVRVVAVHSWSFDRPLVSGG